ncbi:MAG: HAD hydrolase-like protein [Myxococcota bacterium]
MRSLAFALVATCLGTILPQTASAQSDGRLLQVLDNVRTAYNKQQRPMVIFDLDGTIFDNRTRTLKILQEYADKELQSVRPEAAAAIKALTKDRVSYGLSDTLNSAGVTEEAVVNNAAVFWSERFFKDDYLKYDEPVDGVVNYVRTLYSNGARIVYLTGRDAPRQLIGTVKSLRDKGLPIGIQGTELIMKPTSQTQDAIFKQQVTNYLRHYGRVVATFDNEPANANVFRRAFPSATVVAFDAPHSPNPPPLLPDVQKVGSFR